MVKPSKRKAKKTNSATHRSYRHTSYKRNGGVRKRAINTSESSGGFTPKNTENTPQTIPIPTTHTARIRIRPRDLWTGSWLRAPPKAPPPVQKPCSPVELGVFRRNLTQFNQNLTYTPTFYHKRTPCCKFNFILNLLHRRFST